MNVILRILGKQYYEGQDPDRIELVTEGVMCRKKEDTWILSYEESDLTGLKGARTIFRIQPGQISLGRTGAARSRMVFQEGVTHESLYQVDVGTLLMSVCAQKIDWKLDESGGYVRVRYSIVIEQSVRGTVEYEILVEPKNEGAGA